MRERARKRGWVDEGGESEREREREREKERRGREGEREREREREREPMHSEVVRYRRQSISRLNLCVGFGVRG